MSPTLAKNFVTQMLMHNLFAVTNLLVTDIIIIIIIIIIQEKIYVAFSPSELQGHVTMSKS